MSRSKTSSCTSSLGYACIALALAAPGLLGACRKKPAALAELTAADGPVEREAGSGIVVSAAPPAASPRGRSNVAPWASAPIGTGFFLGDAARTAESLATLTVGGATGAKLLMQHHTVVRFGGTPGQSRISVELGAVDLSGTGSYALDVGEVELGVNGQVRITSRGNGQSSVELRVGSGRVAANGQIYDLAVGAEVAVGAQGLVRGDAGVPPIDAGASPVDAGASPVDAATTATIEVTGKRAEQRAPGATAWTALPEGAGVLGTGSAVRLGPGTTAKLVARDTTIDLAVGARVTLDGTLGVALEAGTVTAHAAGKASLALPGGALAFLGAAGATTETRFESGPRDTKVTMLRGASSLTGAPGAELGMSRGESAILTRTGQIRTVEAIPNYFDFRVVAGESLTIHDPRPPTAVQFQFDGKCPEGGIIEVDRDGRFRTARVSAGKDFANVLLPGGTWSYRLRCTSNGSEGAAAASGRIAEVRDDGRRPLPRTQGVNDIDADGRNYRISYQSAIPNIAVHVKNPGSAHKLHLASAGKEQVFESGSSTITVPGAQLHEGTYIYWVDRDGVKQEKTSTLAIDFDQTAPQVYIESPLDSQPWAGDIDVRGAVLPGWTAQVDAIAIPVDKQRRFAAKVGTPAGRALAIRLAHPQRGVHYYLRRQK